MKYGPRASTVPNEMLSSKLLQRALLAMPGIFSKLDVTRSWEALQATNTGLPRVLRDPQRDAMFWLTQGKHVVLCVGTGDNSNTLEAILAGLKLNFGRRRTFLREE